MYFTFNALFYTDTLISSKYENGTLIQNMMHSGLSCVVSAIVFSFLKFSGYFSLALDTIIFEVKTSKDYKRLTEKLEKTVKRKLIFFFITHFIFLFFFFYYLSCFCIVYHSTQISWFKGGWISFIISLAICFSICIIFSLCRYIALYSKSCKLYNVQFFLNKIY